MQPGRRSSRSTSSDRRGGTDQQAAAMTTDAERGAPVSIDGSSSSSSGGGPSDPPSASAARPTTASNTKTSKARSFFGGKKVVAAAAQAVAAAAAQVAPAPAGPLRPRPPPPPTRRPWPSAARPDAPLAARAALVVTPVGELRAVGGGGGDGSSNSQASVFWQVTSMQLRDAARMAALRAGGGGGGQQQRRAAATMVSDEAGGPSFSAEPRAAFAVASPAFGVGGPEQWRLLLRVRAGGRDADVALLLLDGDERIGGGGGGAAASAAPPASSSPSSPASFTFGSLVGCSARVETAVVIGGGGGGGGWRPPSAAAAAPAPMPTPTSRGSLRRAFFAGANAEAGTGARVRLPEAWAIGYLSVGLGGGGGGGEDQEEEEEGTDNGNDDDNNAPLLPPQAGTPGPPRVVVAAALSEVDRVSLAPGPADADHAALLETTMMTQGIKGEGVGAAAAAPMLPQQQQRQQQRPQPLVPQRPLLSSSSSSYSGTNNNTDTNYYHGVSLPTAVRARLERAVSRAAVVSRAPLMLVAEGVLDAEACALLCGAATAAQPNGQFVRSRVASGGETPSRTSRSYFFQRREALRMLAVQVDREILAFARAAARRVGRGPAGRGGDGEGEGELVRTEQLQVIAYGRDDFYRAHYDHRVGITQARNATVLVYLCDTVSGGATWLPNAAAGEGGGAEQHQGVRVYPRRGRALIFWSTHADGEQDDCSLHSAEEVLEGQKWLASRWLRSR